METPMCLTRFITSQGSYPYESYFILERLIDTIHIEPLLGIVVEPLSHEDFARGFPLTLYAYVISTGYCIHHMAKTMLLCILASMRFGTMFLSHSAASWNHACVDPSLVDYLPVESIKKKCQRTRFSTHVTSKTAKKVFAINAWRAWCLLQKH